MILVLHQQAAELLLLADPERVAGGAEAQQADLLGGLAEEVDRLDEPDHGRAVGPEAPVDERAPAGNRVRREVGGCRRGRHRRVHGGQVGVVHVTRVVRRLEQVDFPCVYIIARDDRPSLRLLQQPVPDDLLDGRAEGVVRELRSGRRSARVRAIP